MAEAAPWLRSVPPRLVHSHTNCRVWVSMRQPGAVRRSTEVRGSRGARLRDSVALACGRLYARGGKPHGSVVARFSERPITSRPSRHPKTGIPRRRPLCRVMQDRDRVDEAKGIAHIFEPRSTPGPGLGPRLKQHRHLPPSAGFGLGCIDDLPSILTSGRPGHGRAGDLHRFGRKPAEPSQAPDPSQKDQR